jgi:hypothetical protein
MAHVGIALESSTKTYYCFTETTAAIGHNAKCSLFGWDKVDGGSYLQSTVNRNQLNYNQPIFKIQTVIDSFINSGLKGSYLRIISIKLNHL